MLGPFHITGAPPLAAGGDLRRDYPDQVLVAEGIARDASGGPIEGANVDIWQTAPNCLYSSQDARQQTFSFHGIQPTGPDGRYAFTSVRPFESTVPTDGPVGDIPNATGRYPRRPSHLHVIVEAEGFRPLVTEVFPENDRSLDQDTAFNVRDDLVMRYRQMPAGTFPEGFALSGKVDGPGLKVEFDLSLVRVRTIRRPSSRRTARSDGPRSAGCGSAGARKPETRRARSPL